MRPSSSWKPLTRQVLVRFPRGKCGASSTMPMRAASPVPAAMTRSWRPTSLLIARLPMPEPGWIPKPTQPPGSRECMRLAVSCASGIHYRRLRFLDPDDYGIDWWSEWDKLLAERGFKFVRMTRSAAEASGHYWLAPVDSFVYPKPVTHVVVMKGTKLHY